MKLSNLLTGFAFAAAVGFSASQASATILVDVSPTPPAFGSWVNQASNQNFLMQFTLGTSASVTGFNIYSDPSFPSIGQSVTIRIRNDAGGAPDASNLDEIVSSISSITPVDSSTELVGATFAPVSLSAGTYWMGMSGTSSELSWNSFGGFVLFPGQYQLSGETPVFDPAVGQFGYQVIGAGGVPEPATWAMMLVGFAALGLAARRQRKNAAA